MMLEGDRRGEECSADECSVQLRMYGMCFAWVRAACCWIGDGDGRFGKQGGRFGRQGERKGGESASASRQVLNG